MTLHASKNYKCPICLAVQGIENKNTLIRQQDILFKDNKIMVFVASYFIKGAEGHLIIVPTKHYENFYDLPEYVGSEIFKVAKQYSIKLKKAYSCNGINVLQNNEPAAGQHAFHYHLHLFPRYIGVDIWPNMGDKKLASEKERLEFVNKFVKFSTSEVDA